MDNITPKAHDMDTETRFQVFQLNDSDAEVRDYKKRKVHKKTRSGCLTCKAKRVKCDEARPVCIRCRRNSRPCAYGQPDNYGRELRQPDTIVDPSTTGNLSVLSGVTVVPFSSPSAENGTPSIVLMQHLQRHWVEIFHKTRSEEIISLSKSHSLVRNTLLAITASHLRHVSPGVLQHRIAEHFRQYLALQDYQKALDKPRQKLDQTGVDVLLLSAMLLNTLTFALPESESAGGGGGEPDPTQSWVFSSRENRLGWLALQAGLRPLMISMAPYLDRTMRFLGQIFLGSEAENWISKRGGASLDEVPETWITLFELDRAVDASHDRTKPFACETPGDVFLAPVRVLTQLRALEPVHPNVFRNLGFLSKVQPEFRALMYYRDERALWLFGYWLGLMCRYEGLWWCDKRVRRDYKAIHMWLEQLHLTERQGSEGQIWKEMMEEFEAAPVSANKSYTSYIS